MMKLPLAVMVALALVVGVWSALLRVGWALPAPLPNFAGLHGPLMIGGVLGTLIGLERAVAMANLVTGRVELTARRKWHWAYLAPLSSGLGAVALIAGLPAAAQVLSLAAAGVLLAIYGRLFALHGAAYTLVMGLGALCWLAGNGLWWAGQPLYLVVHWWMAFLVLTVVGERLELARMAALTPRRRNLFLASVGLYLLGIVLTLGVFGVGARLEGLGLVALAAWMMRFDIARRTVRKSGVARYIAVCLLSGYVWLAAAGAMLLYFGPLYGGFHYDAVIHAVLLGFIFAMIFGHAPIILPALTGVQVAFHRGFYVALIALHATLVLRVGADLAGGFAVRQWGGLLNAFTLVLFFAMLAWGIWRQRRVATLLVAAG